MIRVTVDLVSAISPDRSKVLGIAEIALDPRQATETKGKKGSYSVKLSKWAPKLSQTWKKGDFEYEAGVVENFDRIKRGSWDLLYLALKNVVGFRNKDKSETKIPGIRALYRIVNPSCRRRPNQEWIDDIQRDLRKELEALDKNFPIKEDIRFHVVVTSEYPRG